MDGASTFFLREHAYCNALLADVEAAFAACDWGRADALLPAARAAIVRHFETEEREPFAAFEAAAAFAGATRVLRGEHARMRALLEALAEALCQRNRDACLSHAATLIRLMVEHQLREEALFVRRRQNRPRAPVAPGSEGL